MVVQTAVYVSRGRVWSKLFFSEIQYFYHFVKFTEKLVDFWPNILGRFVRIQVYVSRETIEELFPKKLYVSSSLSENEQKTIQLFAENYQQECQKLIWRIKRNVSSIFLKN